MTEPGPNEVIVIGSDGFQNVEQAYRIIELHICAADQPGSIREIALFDTLERPLQFESRTLQQQFRTLMHYLKGKLILVQEFFRTLLKTEQVVGPQVAFVIGGPFAGQNRLT